mmetsp:Transcript_44811/g.111061  ORF Transcript_44811/g.111061 Transcript_44811/m.111061 type:complete len:184 (+) Transcript_44811:651-1202(+)
MELSSTPFEETVHKRQRIDAGNGQSELPVEVKQEQLASAQPMQAQLAHERAATAAMDMSNGNTLVNERAAAAAAEAAKADAEAVRQELARAQAQLASVQAECAAAAAAGVAKAAAAHAAQASDDSLLTPVDLPSRSRRSQRTPPPPVHTLQDCITATLGLDADQFAAAAGVPDRPPAAKPTRT